MSPGTPVTRPVLNGVIVYFAIVSSSEYKFDWFHSLQRRIFTYMNYITHLILFKPHYMIDIFLYMTFLAIYITLFIPPLLDIVNFYNYNQIVNYFLERL